LFSITRDNASSNDTLLKAFRKHYNLQAIKFQGDISCLAYVLNLAVQDILKTLIKEAYNNLDNNNIYIIENKRDKEKETGELKSKFNLLIL
jgi:hypothetical protein